MDGRKCPPASPITPLNTIHSSQGFRANPKEKKSRKKTNKKTHLRNQKFERAQYYNGWFSSDDDDDGDETTLFSSKSLSSDSSGRSFYQNRARCDHQIATSRRRSNQKDSEMRLMPVLQGKVKDSFAVVKCSSDPYNDFRTSMVEMIVEREIFGAKDLENLLQCFLSLNSYHHHRVIVEVYTEIWDALFSNWSY
ncbi:transcription repressor OFP8-like [Cornus florida]|uniref:transcription repressor OFP8-like n=1 Tax=Cornus florida TaxID=4283 RepID=UPI00289A5AE5|nr:transcription repressor OFP8-like [Cornus florida]